MVELDKAKLLADEGRFGDAIAILDVRPRDAGALSVFHAVLLERIGRHSDCRTLISRLVAARNRLTDAEMSTCEYCLGMMDWDEGSTATAVQHLERAAFLAKQATDLKRLCWAQLRLWGALSELQGLEATASLLAEVRAHTIRLGDAHTSAGLHIEVAEIEAKCGALDIARTHTLLAKGILENSPNVWLEAWADNVNLAVALISSNLEAAAVVGNRAVELAQKCGVAVLQRACLANFGNFLLLAGRFDEASLYFDRASRTLPTRGDNGSAVVESMASVRLAQGEIELAGQMLERLHDGCADLSDRNLYARRHALATRVKLHLHRSEWRKARALASQLADIAVVSGDRLLQARACLLMAETELSDADGVPKALQRIAPWAEQLVSLPPEFHARYESLLATAAAAAGQIQAAHTHRLRAKRASASLGNRPVYLDVDIPNEPWNQRPYIGISTDASTSASTVAQGIAALVAQRTQPEFVSRELIQILRMLDCVRSAEAVEVSARSRMTIERLGDDQREPATVSIPVGMRGGRSYEVCVEPKTDVDSVASLNALRVVVVAIRRLLEAEEDREGKFGVWPAEEVSGVTDNAVISGNMRGLMLSAKKIAGTNVSVLITGESGTGKEILARAIHAHSPRAARPFIPFNCAAVPRDLLESQLFGHRRGAFTGADRDHPGVIRTARDGTLFLDEIGELALDLQPKLLRFLESGEISPLGEPTPLTVNVRIVAATNANLEQLVQAGRFRDDLFYRLNVLRLDIPPLRERRDEIPSLVQHFVARAAAEFGKERLRVADDALEHLLLYDWPGNVRQLQNELRRMAALAEPGGVLRATDLSPAIRRVARATARARDEAEIAVRLDDRLLPTLARIEREMIRAALGASRGRVEAAARALGISRKGLYLKRQRLGL